MSDTSSSKRKSEGRLPVTPTKTLSAKKGKMEQETADSIIAVLKQAIAEQGTSIGKSIEDLKASINFISADLQDIKGTIKLTVESPSHRSWGKDPEFGK